MADYIDREALLEKIKKRYCSECKTDDYCRACWVDDMIGEIEGAPAIDAIKVVRCKDCVCADPDPRRENRQWCKAYLKIMRDDGFCSRGERRDEQK